MTEKQLEQKLKKEVEKLGGLCLKWVCPGFTGVPDRKCLLPGGYEMFVEVKKPGEDLTPRQEVVRKQLLNLGFTYVVLDCIEMLDAIVTFLKHKVKDAV